MIFSDLATNAQPAGVSRELVAPNAIETLLTLINSAKYKKLLYDNQNVSWVWEKIYYEMESRGFYIAGATVKLKCDKLLQKWNYLKRCFLTYHTNKSKGLCVNKPQYFDLLKRIVSTEPDRVDDIKPGSSQDDHSYGSNVLMCPDVEMIDEVTFRKSDPYGSVRPETVLHTVQEETSNVEQSSLTDILLQIKSLHEASLTAQQENFCRITSLLEQQVKQQEILSSLFTQYFGTDKGNKI